MNLELNTLSTRRHFVRQAACAALGTIGLTNAIRDMRLINSAAGQITLNDYKALVCIFLSGGNDSNNLVIPRGSEYPNYAALRQLLAVPESSLLKLNAQNGDGREYGLHPACPELQTLFGESKLALLFNVGVLSYPITREQYANGTVPAPPQLFSHSDQTTQWQTSITDQPPKSGWGGRMADLLHPEQIDLVNGVPSANSAKIALCTSLAGANTFEVGNTYQQYHLSSTGAVALDEISGARLQAMKDLLAIPSVNLQQEVYADVFANALSTGTFLNSALAPTSSTTFWNVAFPNTALGNQLRMVARLIAARNSLNMKRQIFFVSVGGYDTHGRQVNDDRITGSHANLLGELSKSIFAFQRAMEQIAATGGEDPALPTRVTGFTASDFGRTIIPNGQGSDHGWGGHHLVFGGAVRGQRTYGTFPILQLEGPDDSGTGRWLPRVSVDEYSATIAKWFGVSSGMINTVFPNLDRFATRDLGFMS